MKRDKWIVSEKGRLDSSRSSCFYCGENIGSTHKEECIMRRRTIVMEMKVEIVIDVPEIWDEYMCDFHHNESSWCSSNIIENLKHMDKAMGCLCDVTEFKYIREATKEDEDMHKMYVSKFKS